MKRNIWSDTVKVFVHDMRSHSRHIDDIISDYKIMNNDMVFTEIKISPLDSTWKKIGTLNFLNINFNNNENRFLSLAIWWQWSIYL